MNKLKTLLILCLILFSSIIYANGKIPSDLKQIADIVVKRYRASQKLQHTVEDSAHHLSVQWIEVFDEKGFIIAHSHPSRVYRRKPLKQPHYNAVISVLHSGHPLVQESANAAVEEYYPITFHRKPIGVIEIIKR